MILRSFAKVSAGVVTFTALGMLGAYTAGFQLQQPFVPPWSCVAFLAAGLVLWGQQRLRKASAALSLISGLVLLVGMLTLGQYALNKDFGVDRLLFPRLLLATARHPGRPAALTGFNFTLIGLTLFLLPAARKPAVLIRELCAVTVITLCYFAFVGDLFRPGPRPAEIMSPVAAALAMLAAACALAARPEGNLVTLLRDAGPAGIFARRLTPVPLALPVLTALTRSTLQRLQLFDARASEALIATLEIVVPLAIVWLSSSQVLRLDRLRRSAEDELRKSRDELDRRVRLRTRELLHANEQLAVEVSERQKTQAELQHTNAILSSVIEACPLALCAFNLDGSVRKFNAPADAIRLASDPECRKLVQGAIRGEHFAAVEVTCAPQGRELSLSVWAAPILAPEGNIDGVVLMAADISDRKALELQIRQTQKLESLGVLAGGIAHDFNNLLTGVMGNASLLQERVPEGSVEAEASLALVQAGERMAALTTQMLAYSGRGRFNIQPVDLSAQVAEITSLIRASIPKNVQLRLALEDRLPRIDADASQLQQVIMNLVINAAESIGASQGFVDVSTSTGRVAQRELETSVTGQPVLSGNYVILVVRDTGSGMDEETQARIFDPFFTTKFTGRGLGLSAVLGIVRSHRGGLLVDSRPGAGSAFRVLFPTSETRRPAAEATQAHFSRGHGTVLIVDDEDMVRRTAQLALQNAGYDVVTARDGQEAITAYEAMPDKIDIVLLDMTMPVMSGEETLARLKARWSHVTVIVMSGYAEQDAQQRFGNRAAGFMQKPFTAARLAEKVAEVLRSSAYR